MTVSQQQLLALQEAIVALHECHDRDSLQREAPGIFLKLAPNYDEQDESLLQLLRPHYEQVCRNIRQSAAQLKRNVKPLATHRLTAREAEVAHWLAKGKSNPEIACILGNSVRTVEKHVEAILSKLAVEHRTAAALVLAGA
jgi:DNA-binding NarL/FixJ family response regulator